MTGPTRPDVAEFLEAYRQAPTAAAEATEALSGLSDQLAAAMAAVLRAGAAYERLKLATEKAFAAPVRTATDAALARAGHTRQ